jgi:glycosyltransferase involved in cell wall biosynthesis
MPRLESLIQELALADLVSFLGLRSDIPEILAGIDVFVSSSHTEGFSLALVEAMASGKPSVATRSGGPERIIDAGNTGLLVATRDPSALAAAIASLMRDSASKERLGMAAKSAMTSRYSGARMLGDYERLISEVLANRRR